VRIYDAASKLFLAARLSGESDAGASRRVFALPRLEGITPTYFLSLRLLDATGTLIVNNFYWLSMQPDILDYETKVKPWEYYTPSREYADLTLLNSLPPADVGVTCRTEKGGRVAVDLANHGDKIAFFIELLLIDENTGEPVVPVFWQDNYVSLLPREARTVTVEFAASSKDPFALIIRGWNIDSQRHPLVRE
jgi:exo-1,4-beta-D-glucosaminidase